MTTDDRQIEEQIEDEIYGRAANDAGFAIAYAILQLTRALNDCSSELSSLAELGEIAVSIKQQTTP